ncbi:hypothetical protein GCM10029964_112340 [Kibdelosporangium lantanae]
MTVVVGLVTGLVLAFVAAATAFYVSAAGSAAVQYAVGHRCATDNGLHLSVAKADPWRYGSPERARAVAAEHGGDVVFHTRAYLGMGPLDPVVLLSRDGAFDNVRVLAGGNRDGVWIPSDVAAQFHLAPGDSIPLSGIPVPVGAVFQVMSDPVAPFWCADRNYVVPDPTKGVNGPPATLLVSSQLLDRLVGGHFSPLESHFDVSTSRPLTTETQAADWARDTAAMRPALVATLGGEPAVTDYAALSARTTGRTEATMWAAVSPLTVISVLAGLLGVIGLAAQWTQRRGTEVRLLWTRGVSPAAIGGKAVLEMGTPLLAGGVLGWAAAWLTAPCSRRRPSTTPGRPAWPRSSRWASGWSPSWSSG